MKIVNEPPKTGEEFTSSYIWSDGKAESSVCCYAEDQDQFLRKDSTFGWISVEDSFFNHKTILVSKGEE